jgi:hypothetical protein
MNGRLRNGSTFPCGSSVGGSLLGIQKDIGRRARRMDMSVRREILRDS